MNLKDIYKPSHPIAVEYIFFSSRDENFPKKDQITDYKTNFSEFKNIEVILIIFSNHNGMKLEINK